MKATARRTAAVELGAAGLYAGVYLCLYIFGGLVSPSTGAAPGARAAQESVGSCKTFVRDFYNWYAQHYDQPEGWLAVIEKERSADFSPELLAALRDYAQAPENEKDETAPLDLALDFDPILNAQDNDDRYVTGEVAHSGDMYRVEVYGITEGRKRGHAQVVADLKFKDGHWIFVNFEYGPWRGDLLSLLKKLKQVRESRQAASPTAR